MTGHLIWHGKNALYTQRCVIRKSKIFKIFKYSVLQDRADWHIACITSITRRQCVIELHEYVEYVIYVEYLFFVICMSLYGICMRRIVYCWMAFVCRPVVLKPRLHDTTSCQTGCTTGLTTGCIGLHDTAVLSNRLSNRIDNRFGNRLYRVNGALRKRRYNLPTRGQADWFGCICCQVPGDVTVHNTANQRRRRQRWSLRRGECLRALTACMRAASSHCWSSWSRRCCVPPSTLRTKCKPLQVDFSLIKTHLYIPSPYVEMVATGEATDSNAKLTWST